MSASPETLLLSTAKPWQFKAALAEARAARSVILRMTTPPAELPSEARYFLTDDGLSGFGITDSGELVGLFSVPKGRGDWLLQGATLLGATHLDCFDGYLPAFYERYGFREVRREPNWAPGEPDVVYMRRDA